MCKTNVDFTELFEKQYDFKAAPVKVKMPVNHEFIVAILPSHEELARN